MSKPVVIDLFCGLGGWSKGFLAEGWDAVGFDIERHSYGDKRYPAQLVLQDVLTLDGRQFRGRAQMIVASPPCQKYSYMAMPFSRGKREAAWHRWERDSPFGEFHLNDLFDACFRIAAEAELPLVVENVKGAQPWVGRAKANYGSYYLWGDIANVGGRIVRPDGLRFGAPSVKAAGRRQKREGRNFHAFENGFGSSPGARADPRDVRQNEDGEYTRMGLKHGGDCFSDPCFPGQAGQPCNKLTDPRYPSGGTKFSGASGRAWFDLGPAAHASRSNARKAASAMIAEIPFDLASYIARVFKP